MPETYLRVQLPDEKEEVIYSPSTIITQYFEKATVISLDDFQSQCTAALNHASKRVYERFGYECTSAMGELARVNHLVEKIKSNAGPTDKLLVKILSLNS